MTRFALAAEPATSHLCTDGDFSLLVPAEWERVKVETEGVLCAFRRPPGFPTINVLKMAGSYPYAGEPLAIRGARTLESYRSAGITDAALLCTAEPILGKTPAFRASLGYTNAGTRILSDVTIVSSAGAHYIITRLDRGFGPRSCDAADEILSTVALKTEAAPPPSTQTRWLVYLIGFYVLAGLTIAIGRRWRAAK